MKQQNKLRNTLRDFYDTQEVLFDDNEWERASAYLNAARRKRKIKRSVFISTGILSMLYFTLFHFPKLISDGKHQGALPEQLNSKPLPILPSAVHSAPKALDSKTKINSNLIKESKHFLSNKISKPRTSRNTLEAKLDTFVGKTALVFESGMSELKLDSDEQENAQYGVSTIHDNPEITTVVTADITANTGNEQSAIRHEAALDSMEDIKIVSFLEENLSRDQKQHQTTEVPEVVINPLPKKDSNIAVNGSKKEVVVTDSAKNSVDTEKAFTAFVDTLGHYKDETVTAMEIEETLPEPLFSPPLADEGIFYEAGAAWYYGWKGAVNRDARGFSPMLGLNYMNRLNNRCSVSFGIQYLQVRNLSNSSKTSRVSTYVYGEQSKVTVVTPSTIHYLLLPLRLHYYTDRRNSFGIGANLAYLLNVDAKVTNYDESPGFKGNYETVKLSGYTQGFSWFDSQLAFFYNRKIGSVLGLQAEVFIGLTDVKQNEFFGFKNTERNSGVKLSLIYYAFRKKDR